MGREKSTATVRRVSQRAVASVRMKEGERERTTRLIAGGGTTATAATTVLLLGRRLDAGYARDRRTISSLL